MQTSDNFGRILTQANLNGNWCIMLLVRLRALQHRLTASVHERPNRAFIRRFGWEFYDAYKAQYSIDCKTSVIEWCEFYERKDFYADLSGLTMTAAPIGGAIVPLDYPYSSSPFSRFLSDRYEVYLAFAPRLNIVYWYITRR